MKKHLLFSLSFLLLSLASCNKETAKEITPPSTIMMVPTPLKWFRMSPISLAICPAA